VTYRLLVRRQAKGDLKRAASWYERQLEGLGREFVTEVEGALDRIVHLHRDPASWLDRL